MKNCFRGLLIGVGVLGLVVSIPLVVVIWKMSGFAGSDETIKIMIYCIVPLVLSAGFIFAGYFLGNGGNRK